MTQMQKTCQAHPGWVCHGATGFGQRGQFTIGGRQHDKIGRGLFQIDRGTIFDTAWRCGQQMQQKSRFSMKSEPSRSG